MYTAREILSGVREPQKIVLELNRLYHRELLGQTGIRMMDEDWDNLLVLDACRYDLFEQVSTLDGELRSVTSTDSSTSGFLQHNFQDRYYPDTVYVSANPQVQRHDVGKRFHDCIRLWEDDWDAELRTVRPEDVTDRALDVHEQYPNKRLIVHYIQPHYPFIGGTGQQIEHGSVTGDGVIRSERGVKSVWHQLEDGSLEKDVVWKAYRENLEVALPEVERLLSEIPGKSVVTSDHGNSFGELGVYGHPGGIFLQSLVKVPWLERSGNTRKEIQSETTRQQDRDVDGDISDRLADLGYK